jgi:hypothetical protein
LSTWTSRASCLELLAVAGLRAHFHHIAAGTRRQVDVGFIQPTASGAQCGAHLRGEGIARIGVVAQFLSKL